jgi:hypothetical protein
MNEKCELGFEKILLMRERKIELNVYLLGFDKLYKEMNFQMFWQSTGR